MSVEAISWALNHAPVDQPSVKFVLVGLANNADADGVGSFPSIERLMRYTGLSKRTVQDALDVLEAAKLIRPCDPAIVAARIKRADRRPKGWDLDMTKAVGDGKSLAAFQAAYAALQAKRKRQAEQARERKRAKAAVTSGDANEGQPLTPVETGHSDIRTGVNGDSNGGQPLLERGLTIARPFIRKEPSRNRPGTVLSEDARETDAPATADAPLASLAPPPAPAPLVIDRDSIAAHIADELSVQTGLEVTPAHATWVAEDMLTRMPPRHDPALWVRGQIRVAEDIRQFLTPDLAAAYTARARRPAVVADEPGRSRKAVPLPDDFKVTDAMRRWANRDAPTGIDLDHETEQFKSHHRARGTKCVSWPDEWQKWVRNARPRPQAAAVAGGHQPYRNPVDQSVYYEDL